MDQPKVERMLRLMQLLSTNANYTLDELGQRLGLSRRTMFRYIDTFKSAGFAVQRIGEGTYKMATYKPGYADLSQLVYFSEEEAIVVARLIENLDSTNAMKDGLKRKLAAVYDATSIGSYTTARGNSEAIEALDAAIKGKHRARLCRYSSSHSGATKDYVVEPFRFNSEFIDLWAWDTADGVNKRFKIARIGEVKLLDEPWEGEAFHEAEPMDAFRIHGPVIESVRLKLKLVAKNLLLEEYPLSVHGLRQEKYTWYWEGEIRGMEGVGRFCLGLSDFVTVEKGAKLKRYLVESGEKIAKKFAK